MYTLDDDYLDIERTTEVLSASNHRLIQLLMDKWVDCINQAERCDEKNSGEISKHISRSIQITRYLKSCLDTKNEPTKAMSTMLAELYEFVEHCLQNTLETGNKSQLKHASHVFKNIKYGWDNMPERSL